MASAPPSAPPTPRRRRLLLLGVGIGLIASAVVLLWHRDIDAPTAAKMADRLQVQYARGSGDRAGNVAPREDARWADGWELRWRYRPCPEVASLRIWISRDGRRASYAELPECAPEAGVGRGPVTV